jgi:phosphohistidine phosphatase SixA
MQRHLFRIITSALITLGFAISPFAQEKLSPRQAIAALKAGGHIIYFRHFETGADTPDQHLVKLDECATQRQLSEKGVRQAVWVRNAFQSMNIPVGEVLASPFCRAWQSADLSFGRHVKVDGLKLPPSKDYTNADMAAMRATLAPLLAKAPASGTNTVIMAHDDNMPAVGGPEIKTQGEALVIRPEGKGGFTVIASIQPGNWR